MRARTPSRSFDDDPGDPLRLLDAGSVGADEPQRVAVVDVERLAVDLESEQRVGVVGLPAVEVRKPVQATPLQGMDPYLGLGSGAGAFDEVAHPDAAPALARAPTLDTRDREGGFVLRQGAELVPGERQRATHLALDAEAVVGTASRADHAGGRRRPVHGESLGAGI